ncbi:MAG TPA: DUF2155 domain-containing protein [Rhodopila sp.]|nr:DUF2155 domain-containing protein [Rhodopila sp.]
MLALVAVGSVLAVSARAQNAPIQATPLPPLQEQEPGAPTEPYLQAPAPQTPDAPTAVPQAPGAPTAGPQAGGGQDAPGANGQGQAAAPSVPPPTVSAGWPNVWLPAGEVRLQALDKVNAQATELTVKVGQTATFGSLTIAVKACVIRPPDQPADAAAYLDVTDSHPDSPGFDGWMLEDEPSVSMMQHPIYDLRVTGCSAAGGSKG